MLQRARLPSLQQLLSPFARLLSNYVSTSRPCPDADSQAKDSDPSISFCCDFPYLRMTALLLPRPQRGTETRRQREQERALRLGAVCTRIHYAKRERPGGECPHWFCSPHAARAVPIPRTQHQCLLTAPLRFSPEQQRQCHRFPAI